MIRETYSLPMVALRGLVILPEEVRHFDVSREKSLKAIEEAMLGNQKIFLSAQKEIETDDPKEGDVYQTGCIATIKQVVKLPKKISRVLISGEIRACINTIEFDEPYLRANVTTVPDTDTSIQEIGAEEHPLNLEAMIRGLRDVFKEYMLKNPKLSKELALQVDHIDELKRLVDVIAANMPLSCEAAQELLEEPDVLRRYELLIYKIVNEIQILNVKEEIQAKVKERVDKNQREYILREELKLIREELGDDHTISDADEFQQAVDTLHAAKEVKEKLTKEIKRFRNSMSSPAEIGVIRTYIETMLEMPWDKTCKEHKDIEYARKVLDEDHYGLEKVKERVLEFLAVRALTKKGEAPILCLVGPPGTGKSPQDFCGDTRVFEPEYRQDGASLEEMLYWMIVSSDNTAANTVISLLGFDRINRYFRSLGLTQTRLQRKMLDDQAIAQGRNNYTSPAELYRLFSMLYHGRILNGPLCSVALDYLKRCRSADGLQRYIPDPVAVAHKPGELDHLNHDAGIFLLKDRPYYLGIFTWDGPALDGEPQQNRLIGQLSRMIYDAVKGETTQ